MCAARHDTNLPRLLSPRRDSFLTLAAAATRRRDTRAAPLVVATARRRDRSPGAPRRDAARCANVWHVWRVARPRPRAADAAPPRRDAAPPHRHAAPQHLAATHPRAATLTPPRRSPPRRTPCCANVRHVNAWRVRGPCRGRRTTSLSSPPKTDTGWLAPAPRSAPQPAPQGGSTSVLRSRRGTESWIRQPTGLLSLVWRPRVQAQKKRARHLQQQRGSLI